MSRARASFLPPNAQGFRRQGLRLQRLNGSDWQGAQLRNILVRIDRSYRVVPASGCPVHSGQLAAEVRRNRARWAWLVRGVVSDGQTIPGSSLGEVSGRLAVQGKPATDDRPGFAICGEVCQVVAELALGFGASGVRLGCGPIAADFQCLGEAVEGLAIVRLGRVRQAKAAGSLDAVLAIQGQVPAEPCELGMIAGPLGDEAPTASMSPRSNSISARQALASGSESGKHARQSLARSNRPSCRKTLARPSLDMRSSGSSPTKRSRVVFSSSGSLICS